ncbi:hypothetical protein J3D54_003482 [Pseudomonas sp. GGS8]|nr:hypothetical protein [Pseudomonas sp. GGS8]
MTIPRVQRYCPELVDYSFNALDGDKRSSLEA